MPAYDNDQFRPLALHLKALSDDIVLRMSVQFLILAHQHEATQDELWVCFYHPSRFRRARACR